MLCIGLTGGIGAGKTAVSNRFAALGVPVIDTDIIAHQLTRPGQPALTKIHHHFGPRVFDPAQQQLDRAALRALVLKNPASRKKLESILHPLIEATVTLRLHCVHAPICLLVVPLLLEVGWHTKVDRILVIDAPDTLRRRWIKARSHLSDSEIDALFASQTNRNTRLSHADEVINNHQGRSYLYRQVDELHRRYLRAVICT